MKRKITDIRELPLVKGVVHWEVDADVTGSRCSLWPVMGTRRVTYVRRAMGDGSAAEWFDLSSGEFLSAVDRHEYGALFRHYLAREAALNPPTSVPPSDSPIL